MEVGSLGFAVVGAVLVITALGVGLVDRSLMSFPLLFAAVGVAIGPLGTGWLKIAPGSHLLGTVAAVVLALMLFLDAVHLETSHLRHRWRIPALIIGPGTLLAGTAAAGAAMLVAGLDLRTAVLVGALLVSTDPVMLRDVLRDRRIPSAVRHALTVEAGTNDVVILPVLLVTVALAEPGPTAPWPLVLTRVLVVAPAVGFAVGTAGAKALAWVQRRWPVRREYHSLHGLGLVLLAYAGGQAIGGDGLLAAFAAGLAVGMSSEPLCQCFLDFGGAITEMAMLVTFVLFGAALSPLAVAAPLPAALVLAGLLLVVIRPASVALVLVGHRRRLSRAGVGLLAWFGPRGLASLLFGLIVYNAGLIGDSVFGLVGVVVAVSIVVHGASARPLAAWYGRRVALRPAATVARATPRDAVASLTSSAVDSSGDGVPAVGESAGSGLHLPR